MLSDDSEIGLSSRPRLVRCHVARRDKNFLDVDFEDAAKQF